MMNHHLPPMPHGQPMPPPRRQHDMPYSSGPPNVRSPPAYLGYHHPHGSGPVPPYPGQQFQQWYSYQQQAQAHPPPRPYQQQPYGPLIVSSYPQSQPVPTPANVIPPPSLPPQPPSAPTLVSPQPPLSPAPSNFARANGNYPVNPPPPVNRTKSSQASREPFHPPLPWLSVPDAPFPAKIPRRRRKPRALETSAAAVQLPAKDSQKDTGTTEESKTSQAPQAPEHNVAAASSDPQTPVTSHAPSETDSTQPTTPSSSAVPPPSSRAQSTQSQAKSARPAVPIVPVVPIIPQSPSTSKQISQDAARRGSTTPKSSAARPVSEVEGEPQTPTAAASTPVESNEESTKEASAPKPAPKSWADLVRTKGSQVTGSSTSNIPPAGTSGLGVSKSASLVDVLSNLGTNVDEYSNKIAFVEPRGLVNTGNMCYMNSVLQILVFCVPFYELLDRVGQQAAHSFKAELPLIDSMIMFLREYRIIDAATSPEQLRLRLKQSELEQYGEAFTPEYVYQVIRHLPRFRDMRRGHQQDAQEFLGFLLEELHEECVLAMKSTSSTPSDASTPTNGDLNVNDEPAQDGWLEVGHKQKANVTRSSGHVITESPITKIFGGKIRSEFRVPGNKNSVTLEPYQPLQLDIGSPQVNNIIDALKGLTRPETMQGDFNSSRGPKVSATKQVFIETLPPVLILHLKRFHYDSTTRGTQKIWKKIGYPLELEIPKEVFSPHRRAALSVPGGLPKYRLIGVIYHHGKNASGGHYTVDVRRQDGQEWIRLDDTLIRRVRSEDVANAGSEEDPKILAAALERHKGGDKTSQGNIFEQFDQEEQDQRENDRGWSQVNGAGVNGHSSKKSVSTGAANGTDSPAVSGVSSGKGTPSGRYAARDNKVAYLLFYQRINTP